MTSFRRQLLVKAFMLFDLAILLASYLVAAIPIWHLAKIDSIESFISMRVKVLNIVLLVGVTGFWHVIFVAFGLYRSRRLGDRKEEVSCVLKATAVAALMLGLVAGIFRVHMITLAFVVAFWFVSSLFLILSRLLMREALEWIRTRGRNLRYVLIVGTNPRALEFAGIINERPELGYQFVGFADDMWTGNHELGANGKSLVTDLEHFSDFLHEHIVDEVIIALPIKSFYSQAARIVALCHEQGVLVRVMAGIFDLQDGRRNNRQLESATVATFSPRLSDGWPMVCKRLLDMFSSLFLLLLFAPIFVVTAILIKLDSTGPAFFVQERVGLNKRRFRMYKFRTMVVDAEIRQSEYECLNEADGPVFKIKDDPRVTRLGRLLRKASIDELPQLLNVLKGDMSLVGPRPLPIRDYRAFDQGPVRRRFSVRPGVTCLWQVNGRSSVSFQEWMELDLHYVDHWSLWLDLKVIAKTIPAVLKGVGAV